VKTKPCLFTAISFNEFIYFVALPKIGLFWLVLNYLSGSIQSVMEVSENERSLC